MPIKVANEGIEKIKEEIQKQVEQITLELDEEGIIIKADTLGSLEALINLLREKNILIKRASIGEITKKDLAEASAELPEYKAILGFNIKKQESKEIKIITNDVIYKILDEFEEWQQKVLQEKEAKLLEGLTKLCKIKILEGYIFRQSNPAVSGTEVLAGSLKSGTPLFKDDKKLTEAKEIQKDGKKIDEAKVNDQIAVSFPNVTLGRQLKETDILYSDLTETEFKRYKDLKEKLTQEDIQILKDIAELKRKSNPSWGM